MHLEFVVPGPPISNQSPGPNLSNWRAKVAGEAQNRWAKPLLVGDLKAVIINFYPEGKPSVDVDNMSKPILDVMQDVIYSDDRQITQLEISHVKIDSPFSIPGVSKLLVSTLQTGKQFVYVRLEDPVDPFPLPK